MLTLVFFVLAFIATGGLIPLAARFALRCGHVDQPGGRKDHETPTPPVGGLTIIPVFILLSLASHIFGYAGSVMQQWPFWAALLVMVGVGALDDRFEIKPRWKFLAQFVAACLIVVHGQARVSNLGDLLGFGDLLMSAPWDIVFSMIATILLINAINLIDGIDGLAGGMVFVALFWMLMLCLYAGASGPALSMGILMGALAGFLLHNMRHPLRDRAAVFLGDAGSMSLGLSLAWFAMTLGYGNDPVIWPIAVAWILALPIMDTCAQFGRRIAQGRHPFSPDRNHFHHHFVNAGVTPGRTTAFVLVISFVLGMIGLAGMVLGLPEPVLSYLWIAAILLHIAISLRPVRFRRLIAGMMRSRSDTPQ